MQAAEVLLSGALIAIIGALPFGLVNLTVLDTSYKQSKSKAIMIAHGAALIEVLFGIVALLVGGYILHFTKESLLARFIIVLIPGIAGIVFFLRKDLKIKESKRKGSDFLKGVILNLISIQVLMYWFIAVAFLTAKQLIIEPHMFIYFSLGIWFGKMFVLWLYARLSGVIFARASSLAPNMNRIIGGVLMITAAIQLIK